VAEKRATTPVKGPGASRASAASGNSSVTSKKEKESNAKKLASATANWRKNKKTKEL